MKWRKDNHIDDILKEDLSTNFPHLPVKVEGVDKEGSPILQTNYGKWELRKYAWSGNREFRDIPERIFIQALEKAEDQIYENQKRTGQNISQIYALHDVEGYSVREHGCLQCISITANLIRAYSLHYPSLLKKAVIINAPKIFSQAVDLINEIAPSEVTQSISIYGRDKVEWTTAILKDISPDQLPINFGGTREN